MQFPVANRRRFQVDSEDMISRMPKNVITNVLDRLPLQEAVRTSILSRNWRFSWTLLTQLVFDDKFFSYLVRKNQAHLFYKRNNLAKLLLQHKGSITKFVLYIPDKVGEYNTMYADIVEDINHWILFLSTKGIKEFTLMCDCDTLVIKVPSHLFSCLELKHLYLRNCCINPPPGFHCFPNLLGFEFDLVTLDGCKYGEFITRCTPFLEILKIKDDIFFGEVKLGEIAKLANLKRLSLWLSHLGDKVVTSSDILHLIGSLPKLEKLNLRFAGCDDVILGKVGSSMRSPVNLHCLKTLVLKEILFESHIMVECAYDLINGLPNLQTLKMTLASSSTIVGGVPIHYSSKEAVCSIKGNLQLQHVDFCCFCCSENEVRFIESLLAYSPLLKKMVIDDGCYGRHKASCWWFARKLLKLHRSSPVAEIYLY